MRGGEQVEGGAQPLPGIQGFFLDPAVPPRRAGSSPIASSVPKPIGAPLARLRHQPGCAQGAHRPTGRDQLDPPL